MRILILLSLLLALGCHQEPQPEPTKEEPIKTRPNFRRKPKRMVASEKKPIVVAIIDTGLKIEKGVKYKLCKFGHKNFTYNSESVKVEGIVDQVPTDNHGHGTNIAGLIQKYAGTADYCMVILKYYDPRYLSDNLVASMKAIKYATDIKVDIINYSGGGTEISENERSAIKKFLDQGGRFIAAAGNEASDIDKPATHYFPAMSDPRVIVVGNAVEKKIIKWEKIGQEFLESDEAKEKKTIYIDNVRAYPASSSNYGYRVNRWEYGTNQAGDYGSFMTGTSQATAVATGKIIKQSECDK